MSDAHGSLKSPLDDISPEDLKSDVLKYSQADFHHNDNPDVLSPPVDYERWRNHPLVSAAYRFFEQPFLAAPRVRTELMSPLDGQRRKVINLTSYNYLGLSTHPEVIQAAKDALDRYGLGASGAPQVSGSFDLHQELARKLAAFKQKEACLLYSGGLGANYGAIQGLMRKGDVFILDEKCHMSMIDGGKLSGAKMLFFDHNDMSSLEANLAKSKGKRTLVAVEGVYSMDGDLVNLPEVVKLCKHYGAAIYIDEAHSTLMFGKNGRGVAEHFGLEHEIGVSYGTFSKSFGAVGGFVCSNAKIIRYMKGYSSAWNFSCAPSPPVVGGLIKALEVATRDSSLRDKLWANVAYMKKALEGMKLDLGGSESQVIPIIIGSDGMLMFKLAMEIQRRGLFLQFIDYPAVPAHARRFRISVSAQLEKVDMDEALNIIDDVIGKAMRAR